ncbi:MAG: hypothetical protein CMN22_07430 [Rubrivirga sp.]|nr:hypothetical protein [Rubrivirga sp.]
MSSVKRAHTEVEERILSSTVRESILKSIRGGEDLAGQNFSGVNLSEANLDGAKLTATDWTKANLREASLRFAILTDADLSGADLSNANLFGADMRFVNFQGTVLTGADMAGADLLGAKNLPRDVGSYESTPETSRGISGGEEERSSLDGQRRCSGCEGYVAEEANFCQECGMPVSKSP